MSEEPRSYWCSKKRCENWATYKCYNCRRALDLRDNYERKEVLVDE